MTTLTIDPAQYAAAATDLAGVAEQTHNAISVLSGALGESSGMGGSDDAGVEWATSYDDGARAALDAAASAVGATGSVAQRLHATGENHAHADASSTIGGGGDASLGAAPSPPFATCPSVPSASGGGGDQPAGWSLVSGLVGYVWPNGHQDRLYAADAAWKAGAAALQTAAAPTAVAASKVVAQQSPEAAAAANACTDTGDHLCELSSVFTEIGSSCSEYAAHLDEAHHEIISTLKELLIETAAIEAAGAAFAIFTAGLDEIAAQAAVAARIATAAAKIRRVIEALIDAARGIAAAAKVRAAKAVEVLAKLKPMEGAAVRRAEATTARTAGGEASAASKYEYNMIENPGPLAEGKFADNPPAANFAGGRYREEVLDKPTALYRGGDHDSPFGRWFTEQPPASAAEVRIDTAVKPQWIDERTGASSGSSPINTVHKIEIPEGTTIYRGPTANQGGIYVGGKEQIYIDAPWNGGKVLDSWPLK